MILAGLLALGLVNDGFMAETGTALNFSKSRQVQMVSEKIRISMGHPTRISVDFVFKNHGAATTVVMGFPDHGSNEKGPFIKNFKSWVDGKPVTVTPKRIESQEFDYAAIWTKSVPFAKGQTRKVKVAYDAQSSGAAWGEMPAHYILKTGATWHGAIERAEVTVDWSRLPKHQRPMIYEGSSLVQRSWSVSGRTARRIYRNFTPTFDLRFQVYHGHWNYSVNGKFVEPPMTSTHPVGDPRDVLFPVKHLRVLFPNRDSNRLEGLRRGVIKRKDVDLWDAERVVDLVYLKDLMAKWGWTYSYIEQTGAVSLQPPKRGSQGPRHRGPE